MGDTPRGAPRLAVLVPPGMPLELLSQTRLKRSSPLRGPGHAFPRIKSGCKSNLSAGIPYQQNATFHEVSLESATQAKFQTL